MMTSQYPEVNGVLANLHVLSDQSLTLAEVLRGRGFSTIAYTTHAHLIRKRWVAQDFDEFEFLVSGGSAGNVTNKAIQRLKGELGRPFFMWLHYIDPHRPYTPPPGFNQTFVDDEFYDPTRKVQLTYEPLGGALNKNYVLGAVPEYQQVYEEAPRKYERDFYISQYDGEILYLDDQIKKLIEFLDGNDLLNDTLFIFTSDHGEALGEHNYYFEHERFVYQDTGAVTRSSSGTAGAVGNSATGQAGRPRSYYIGAVGNTGSGKLSRKKLDASSKGWAREISGDLFSNSEREYPRMYRALRLNRWKCIVDDEGNEQLYDLSDDPGEETNIEAEHRELVSIMRKRILDGDWTTNKGRKPKEFLYEDLEESMRENLRSLGYLN